MTLLPANTSIAPFPWNWLESFDLAFEELAGIPLSPAITGFSKDDFEKGLAEGLGVTSCSLEVLDPVVEKKEEGELIVFSFENLEGSIGLRIGKAELEKLLLHLVKEKTGTVPQEYLEPFFIFFKEELKKAFVQSFEKTPVIEELEKIEIEGPVLRYPIGLTLDGNLRLAASLIASEQFIKRFRHSPYCSQGRGHLSDLLAKRVEIPFHLVVGHTQLDRDDWKGLERGDVVLADHLTYPPQGEKGEGVLYYKGQPIYRVRVKEGAIKIVGPAGGIEELMQNDDEETHDDQEQDEVTTADEESTVVDHEEAPLAIPDVPLVVKIELGRFRLPLQQLLDLRPGNVLKVDVDPKKGVDLVVEGKVVGRGELVAIGDLVGVRVTDLG